MIPTNPLHYTYSFRIEGGGRSHYAYISVNHDVAPRYTSRDSGLREHATPLGARIMDSAATVPGISKRLIVADGNRLTLSLSAVTIPEKRRAVQIMVRRLERILGKSGRKCIRLTELQKEIAAVNAKLA